MLAGLNNDPNPAEPPPPDFTDSVSAEALFRGSEKAPLNLSTGEEALRSGTAEGRGSSGSDGSTICGIVPGNGSVSALASASLRAVLSGWDLELISGDERVRYPI